MFCFQNHTLYILSARKWHVKKKQIVVVILQNIFILSKWVVHIENKLESGPDLKNFAKEKTIAEDR